MTNVVVKRTCLNEAVQIGIQVRFASRKSGKAAMRLLGVATAIIVLVPLAANAADINYPSPLIAQPRYGMASPAPAVAPPQVIIVPGPTASYDSAAVPPPPDVVPSYRMAPPILPRAGVGPLSCPPVWQCGERGCGWQPGCVPPPERYSGQYESPGPIYSRPEPPGARAYSSPDLAPPPQRYFDPYAPQLYPGPSGAQ